ncbi:MAG: hypothetical protein F4X40_09035 [Chloroflexi bacterium]|nr:hypothetical protein [Chloroflexota bacterium]
MKSTLLSQSWRASARSKLNRFTALGAVASLLFAATNASLLWTDSLGIDVAEAHHSAAPEDVAVVPGNGKLHVSWRPEAGHSYQLRWRVGDEVASSWNTVDDPGVYRYEIRGLANRTDYDVQVRSQITGATSQSSFSDWSRVESAEPRSLAGASNDTPSWRITHDTVAVEENAIRSGSIAKFTAIGGDTNDIVNYQLLEPVRGPFAINAANGEVYVYEKLDFESVEEYTVTVGATDLGNETIRHDLKIEVIDVAGPDIPTVTQVCAGNQTAFLVWNQTNDATYDIQWRQFDNVDYSASSSRNIRNIDADRRIVENLANGVDWVFRIRAVDKETGEQSKWSAEYVVAPSVAENRANTAPAFREQEYVFSVREEIAAGADVGSVSATDDDPYSQFTFAIGETEPGNAPFEINPSTGKITTTDELDYETTASYTLKLIVTDLCGLTDEVIGIVTVANAIEVDVPALTPDPPAIAVGHEQVTLLWDNFTDFAFDLDWRQIDERYGLEPKDRNASSPRVVEVDNPSTQYAFRLRARNLLGEEGAWSEETIIAPLTEAPTVLPIVSPREGAVFGDALPYTPHLNLRKGQDAAIGVNLFNTDGALENSLIERNDMSIRWTASIGDIAEPEARSTVYTAPHRVGEFAVRVTVQQAVPGGAVQVRLRIPVRVIGEDQEVQIYQVDPYPSETTYLGNDYSVATYNRGGRFEDPNSSETSLEVPALAIPVRDWVGVQLSQGSEATALQSNVRRYNTIGNWYETRYVSSAQLPISGLKFVPHAEVCLPVPDSATNSLDQIEIMLLLDDGVQQLLNSPRRYEAEPLNAVPAKVCARAATFDGLLFLAQLEPIQPTATLVPATATPTATQVPVTPTETPTPTSTPMPPPPPTPVVVPPTATPIPTDTPVPTPSATPTPIPTDTPTPVPTDTSTPVPTATDTPTPVPTDTPVPTETPTQTPEPTQTATPTQTAIPTNTPTSTATSQPTATPTEVPTSTPQPVATIAPPPPSEEETDATLWIIAIALAIAAILIGAGAMVYRLRIAPGSDPDDVPPGDATSQDDVGEVGDEPTDDDSDDYETLTIDMPRRDQ